MSLYTLSWVGLDTKAVLDEIPPATGAKITNIGPVQPPSTITVDTGGNVLSATEETDLLAALLRQGWSFVSKV